ncbi:MAG TPA: hypothetical protein VFR01_00185, partial [Geobacterales bacterium]|nr:hypothetical protein [Geobacterales bacterium]
MTRNVSISIEGNRVKAIVAVQRGLTTRVVEQLTFPLTELESFLARERARDITVSADFRSIYQETILLPPVKKSLERQLLQSELKKKNPSITGDLAIVFFRTGDKTVDGRQQNEYYVYAVETAELDELTELFLRQGKRIRALYPNMLAVLNILPVKSEPFICHYEAGNKKNLFLIKNGKVLFTRSAPSIGPGVVDYDVQNINMTVNYCRQQLRIEPTEVLLIGVGPKDLPTSRPTIPITFLTRPERLAVDDALLAEYLIPLSALGGSSAASIMTDEYRHFYLLSSLVHRGTAAFVLASILLAVLLVPNVITLVELRQALTAMRKDPSQLSAL